MANKKDLANGIVDSMPNATTIDLQTGYGQVMPAVPFYLTLTPPGQLSTRGNSEIVLVTALSGDRLTVTRAQKDTNIQDISSGWIASNSIYVADINTAIPEYTFYERINLKGFTTVLFDVSRFTGKYKKIKLVLTSDGNTVNADDTFLRIGRYGAPAGTNIAFGQGVLATGSGNAQAQARDATDYPFKVSQSRVRMRMELTTEPSSSTASLDVFIEGGSQEDYRQFTGVLRRSQMINNNEFAIMLDNNGSFGDANANGSAYVDVYVGEPI